MSIYEVTEVAKVVYVFCHFSLLLARGYPPFTVGSFDDYLFYIPLDIKDIISDL
jgi:hypothetical protein